MYEDITAKSIEEELSAELKSRGLSTIDGSFISLLLSPIAYKMWERFEELNKFSDLMTMETTDGEWIVKKCADFGIDRKEAQKAAGILTFTGTDGTEIPQGTACRTESGIIFKTTEGCTVSGGSAQAQAQAEEEGALGNVGAGEIKFLTEPISGITAVTNAADFESGADEESYDALKERYFERVRKNPASGNAEDYKAWACEVPGVENAAVVPLWNGAGTVKVILFGADNTAVSAAVVTNAAAHIEGLRPIGAQVTTVSCEAVNIAITANVALKSELTLSDAEAAAKKAIEDYFKYEYESGSIYAARLTQIIMDIVGIENCAALKINSKAADLALTAVQVPKLTSLKFTEVSA